MIHFPDKTLHRHGIVEVSGAGVYGETIQQYEYIDDITVDFQNETNNEIAHEYGVELADLYKIYLDIDTILEDNDKLVDDNGTEYDIIGGIKKYTKFHKYQKAHLQKRRTKQ